MTVQIASTSEPHVVLVGPHYAVMDSFGLRWAGVGAFLVWIFIHLQFLASTLSRFRTASEWLWMLFTNQRADPLIITAKQENTAPEKIVS